MIKLVIGNKQTEFISAEWSGTDTQCSRQLTFTLPSNPYDKDFDNCKVALGELVYLYSDKQRIFVGTVVTRERSAEIGSVSYTALDFMHHLLRSSATYKFKNATPEGIVKKICRDLNIKVANLAKTGARINKVIYEDASCYDIIVAVYRKAKATTGKKYMPTMDGQKVSVIVKGTSSGVTLTQGINVTSATYNDSSQNMVNLVNIYDENHKKLGEVKNNSQVSKYGVYQSTYTKEKGTSSKAAAKAMLVGITKEASIEAIGNIKAVAGKSIIIDDKATGLSGKFFITSDTHTFSDGVHTMSLSLSWSNSMEDGADSAEDETAKKNKGKAKLTNASACYYIDGATVYHSSTSCSACKGKNTTKTTVEKIKTIKITRGANKGKRKFKACTKCWQQ